MQINLPANKKIPLSEIGRSFIIKDMNGKVIFYLDLKLVSSSFLLNTHEEFFYINFKLKKRNIEIIPQYIEFKPEENIDTIIVHYL
jgi:hypothetical protein